MAGLSTALSAAALLVSASQRSERNGTEKEKQHTMEENTEYQSEVLELQRQQLEQEQRNNPTTESIDAFYGTTLVDVQPGEHVRVEYEPRRGYDMKVSQVYVDRREGFDYFINLNGNVKSGANEYDAKPPRRITQSGSVVVEIENNGSSTETVDIQIDAWAEVA